MMPIYGRDSKLAYYFDRLQAVAEMCLFILIFEVIQRKKMLTVVKYNGRLLYLSTWTKINTLK